MTRTRPERALTGGRIVLDGLVVYLGWMAAWWLRFHGLGLAAPRGVPPADPYLRFGVLVALVHVVVANGLGSYRPGRGESPGREAGRVVESTLVCAALAGLASYLVRGEIARSVLPLFVVLAAAAVWSGRRIVGRAVGAARQRGLFVRRVLVVGAGEAAVALLRKIRENPACGQIVAGVVTPDTPGNGSFEGVAVIGRIDDLTHAIRSARADLVYVAFNRDQLAFEKDALDRLADTTVDVRLIPDLARAYLLTARVEDFDETPMVLLTEEGGTGATDSLKRAFDCVASLAGLALASPLLLLIGVWVRSDSPGPALYGQERVGLNGQPFRMYKFRTMRLDAESRTGPAWPVRDDPRRTRAGRILRRFSLDELPQLWNVLRGDMSLVGPRPERPVFVERFRSEIPRYMLRHHVRAGMTGWAQVNGLRGDTSLPRRLEHDLHYIRNRSLAFDLWILLLTVVSIVRDRDAG